MRRRRHRYRTPHTGAEHPLQIDPPRAAVVQTSSDLLKEGLHMKNLMLVSVGTALAALVSTGAAVAAPAAQVVVKSVPAAATLPLGVIRPTIPPPIRRPTRLPPSRR